MNVISRAVVAEIDGIIALRQTFGIFNRDSLPGLAAIHRDIVIATRTRTRRKSGLKRDSDNVVGILRIDGDGNFSRIDGVGIGDFDHTLRKGAAKSKNQNNRGSED